VLYLDSSAIVKLVVPDPESAALLLRLAEAEAVGDLPFSSELARAEVMRAALGRSASVARTAREALERLHLIRLDGRVLDDAGSLLPATRLRTLDAIHLAAARRVAPGLTAVVTYDRRMAAGAAALGLPIESPA
jgi:uncharacterized protein